MKVNDILSAICSYFNGKNLLGDAKLLKAMQNAPSDVRNYIAVKVESVEQDGDNPLQTPTKQEERDLNFLQVASISFIEIEGDGDALRSLRNHLQTKEFREYADGKGFSVWDWESIISVETFDGEFIVKQWRFTARFNFVDENIKTTTAKILGVSEIELNEGE
jgi:hypothetical protein